MPASDYQVDVVEVTDTKVFGIEVIKIALGKSPNAIMSIAEFKARFPTAEAAMYFPASITDGDTIQFIQGVLNHHIVNVPPLHKLLPMLEAVGVDRASLVADAELGFDPNDPPKAPLKAEKQPGTGYPFHTYLKELISGVTMKDDDIFFHRVGDYSIAGCRN